MVFNTTAMVKAPVQHSNMTKEANIHHAIQSSPVLGSSSLEMLMQYQVLPHSHNKSNCCSTTGTIPKQRTHVYPPCSWAA